MQNIQNILIANRGEIASRIIRTCRKMGIRSVAVYSEADKNAPFVAQADMAVFIGESSPSASYLDQDKIIATAKKTNTDAIHPGYGFLSENANFARRCAAEDIIFIGPHPEAIDAMGSKSKAKTLMQAHDVTTVPGYQGAAQDLDTLTEAAKKIGFPLLLKATAGGGGKGMRIVHETKNLEAAIAAAKREALSAFGDDELIIEKYIASGRHIEFQIFGDQQGNIIHLLERECTIQRRYQKVIEESPSPVLTDALREQMGTAAVQAAQALHYDNAGTVEFIFDEKTQDFYFLEVNTRLQVEHPVTEEITGLDLVQMQIESAQGMPLRITQAEVVGRGYAIECRLYAEDAANDFLPVTGTILRFDTPKVEGLRIETAIQSDSTISIFYDPMIAKIIVWDESRQAAHRKMQYTLRHLVCLGMTTNQDFLLHILQNADFQEGKYDTHFIQNKINLTNFAEKMTIDYAHAAIAATLFDWKNRESKRTMLKELPSGWRNNFYEPQQVTYLNENTELLVKYRHENDTFQFDIQAEKYVTTLIAANDDHIRVAINDIQYRFSITQKDNSFFIHHTQTGQIHLEEKARFPIKIAEKIKGGYEASMPSQIIKVLVQSGQSVQAGEGLVVLSSMKMENTIEANEDGTVEEVFVEAGANVEAGFLLLKMGDND